MLPVLISWVTENQVIQSMKIYIIDITYIDLMLLEELEKLIMILW